MLANQQPEGDAMLNWGDVCCASFHVSAITKQLRRVNSEMCLCGVTILMAQERSMRVAGTRKLRAPARAGLIRIIFLLIAVVCATAAERVVVTVAGTDRVFQGDGEQATEVCLGGIRSVAVDSQGNVFAADPDNHLILRVSPDGRITVAAGNGFTGFTGDGGPATSAALQQPRGVAVDAAGNLFIADTGNHRVRRVGLDGMIQTIAGNGEQGFSGDGGRAVDASLNTPAGVGVDLSGNVFIADTNNHRIRKASPNGSIGTFAGGESFGFAGDEGPATSASLRQPEDVATDADGTVYIVDGGNGRIRKVTSDNVIRTVAGNGSGDFEGDGVQATETSLSGPGGIAVDASGNLFIADSFNKRVRQVGPDGVIQTVAGRGTYGFFGDGGPATSAALGARDVAVDQAGTLYIADSLTFNHRIRKVSNGIIETIAGQHNLLCSPDGGLATNATLNLSAAIESRLNGEPHMPNNFNMAGVAMQSNGTLLFGDPFNHRIRKVTPGGVIGTYAGDGTLGFLGDGGPATSAGLRRVGGISVDGADNLFIADSENNRIRRVSPNGIIETFAGTGHPGFSGDGGPATEAQLKLPGTVAADGAGNLFISDAGLRFRRVRRVTPAMTIETVAGGADKDPAEGDDATSVRLDGPGVAVDATGNLLIGDVFLSRIYQVDAEGKIHIIAGNGIRTGRFDGDGGDNPNDDLGDGGPATNATLSLPTGLTVDPVRRSHLISDTANHRIREVTSDGNIHTLVGNGIQGFSGDGGPASDASLDSPSGITVDPAGNVFFADNGNHRIRMVLAEPPRFDPLPTQEISLSGQSGGAPVTAEPLRITGSAVSAPLLDPSSVPQMSFTATVPDNQSWLSISSTMGVTPRLLHIVADPTQLTPGEYSETVTITLPDAQPAQRTVAVNFSVGLAEPPLLDLDTQRLDFTYSLGAAARTQTLVISNSGGGDLDFTAGIEFDSGDGWLSVSPASGTANPASPVELAVSANPAGLPVGTYTGRIVIISQSAAEPIKVPVDMTVTSVSQVILLTQTGLSFAAVADGGVVPAQSFGVLNIGSGEMQWSISTDVPDGGDWLKVTPTSGSTDAAGVSPSVTVSVDQTGLAPGPYYGVVIVSASTTANKAQVVTVFLEVLAAGSNPGSVVDPPELLFTAAKGSVPSSQDLFVYNISADPKTFRTTPGTDDGGRWLRRLPGEGQLDPNDPTRVVVQPFTGDLPAGEYTGALTFQFSDGLVREVPVRVTVSGGGGAANAAAHRASGACIPEPLLTSQVMNKTAKAGWPVALQAKVVDNCGEPMREGSVYVRFSNGDPELKLRSLKNGIWEATWTTSASEAPVTLSVTAVNREGFKGSKEIKLDLGEAIEKPLLTREGIVSSASYEPTPLSPGGFVSIFGDRLSEATHVADSLPLPEKLGDTVILITGGPGIGLLKMPVLLASEQQANGIVPDIVLPNTIHQIYVRRGRVRSQPVYVTVAVSQPAVFLAQPGVSQQGHIYNASNRTLAGPGSPTSAGDIIELWCSGLGPTDPPVPAGTAATPGATTVEELARTLNNVKITIGGIEATVLFSGLSRGSVNLYQVNVVVPEGVTPGDQIDVQLEVAGQKGPPVTMALQ
jgi:uncharacterized protein (TIGR03437 family)